MKALTMNQIREILHLGFVRGLTTRTIAASTGVSRSVVSKTLSRARGAKLTWAQAEGLDDDALRALIYGDRSSALSRAEPDPIYLHMELKKPGVTLDLLHLEYKKEHPDGYQYTAFCERYRRWKKTRPLSMRQKHVAGEQTFIDYSGKRPFIVEKDTGERRYVELFVGVLGASSYTYAEASLTQQLPDFIASHGRMLRFFGGVSKVLVPDQLRSAVSKPSRVDPGINRTYAAFARHHGTTICPARPRKPKDKAKAENAVLIVQRWVLARLRHETHFSLATLNARIRELIIELNDKPMKKMGDKSRSDLFEWIEKAHLKPLPARDYEFATWHSVRVPPDYHVCVDAHYYSVPCELAGEVVDIRATAHIVDILYKNRAVATHPRSDEVHGQSTEKSHMPANHRAWSEVNADAIVEWSEEVGPMTRAMTERILEANAIGKQGVRRATALKKLAGVHGKENVERACELALSFGSSSYRQIESLLRHSDLADAENNQQTVTEHDNVRGPSAYH